MNAVEKHKDGAGPMQGDLRRFDLRRLVALVTKESYQALRDPSTLLIAFVLPVVLLLLFAYAVSLDAKEVRVGVVLESPGASAQSLAAAFSGTRFLKTQFAHDRREVADQLVSGALRGYVVIPQDFEQRLASPGTAPLVQVITDGSAPNTANFVAAYTQGIVAGWLANRGATRSTGINVQSRVWFNQVVESRWFLVPGAIAIIMTMIGTMLTALVIAREWERGTMEALISTPARIVEILVGKLLPYFLLGLVATIGASLLAIHVFGVPFRGSWFALLVLSSAFMVPALGQGLVISAVARNQFVASQLALFTGFLPAFLLSGFLFEIDSMPAPIRLLSYVVPARYFIVSLQTAFLAGDVWALYLPNMLAMLVIGGLFFGIATLKTRKSLDI